MGGISTSKWPHSSCPSRVPIRGCGGCRPGRVLVPVPPWWTLWGSSGVGGGREPVRWWVWSVAHYWVLRQQAPSPLVGVGVLCLGSRRPAGGRVLFRGVLPPVCRVCGLLFENCIVDASILRTGAAGSRASLPSRGVCLVGCGAVFVIDRRDTAAVPPCGVWWWWYRCVL
jgi:hypothetical protein